MKTQTELARLANVTPARFTQVMRLLDLAPGIQERVLSASDAIPEPELSNLASEANWLVQQGTMVSGNQRKRERCG